MFVYRLYIPFIYNPYCDIFELNRLVAVFNELSETEKDTVRALREAGICNTGDGFLTDASQIAGDVIDMEAFAQAFVCRSKEIPFISVKYVTDIIGHNSVKHWEDKLADARQGLSHYFNILKERI